MELKTNKTLFFDNCFFDKCNFNCKYCRNTPDPLLEKDQLISFRQSKSAVDIINKNIDYVIFKISGYGEIVLMKNFIKLLPKDKVVQVITNGSLLNKKIIDELATVPKIHICISMDGHTTSMNCQRINNPRIQERIIENIKYLIKKGISIEINSVLTSDNTGNFHKFLSFLQNLNGKILCYPFPVRRFGEKSNDEIKSTKKDISEFYKQVVKNYDKYSNVLPPKKYLSRLISFYKNSKRSWPCYVPIFNLGVIPNGKIVDCPCGANTCKYSITSKNLKSEFCNQNKIISTPQNLISKNCENCFTHYEIINLYIQGEISKELQKIELFKDKLVTKRLEQIKKYINKNT